ncbi:pseudouridine synthase [Aureococcus anophagefferens]|nr:pseudouridine synthase [Aureococcus anophagefferens]
MHSRSRGQRQYEPLRRLNGRFAVLTIVTSAGMYIGCVHGDPGGRSRASRPCSRADMLQLDVGVEDAGWIRG